MALEYALLAENRTEAQLVAFNAELAAPFDEDARERQQLQDPRVIGLMSMMQSMETDDVVYVGSVAS